MECTLKEKLTSEEESSVLTLLTPLADFSCASIPSRGCARGSGNSCGFYPQDIQLMNPFTLQLALNSHRRLGDRVIVKSYFPVQRILLIINRKKLLAKSHRACQKENDQMNTVRSYKKPRTSSSLQNQKKIWPSYRLILPLS